MVGSTGLHGGQEAEKRAAGDQNSPFQVTPPGPHPKLSRASFLTASSAIKNQWMNPWMKIETM